MESTNNENLPFLSVLSGVMCLVMSAFSTFDYIGYCRGEGRIERGGHYLSAEARLPSAIAFAGMALFGGVTCIWSVVEQKRTKPLIAKSLPTNPVPYYPPQRKRRRRKRNRQ